MSRINLCTLINSPKESVPANIGETTQLATMLPTLSQFTASTDILAELARAILDRRDIAVDDAGKNMTLEGMVREMLKPLLREWLDRNLPYLIERLVKKEIDTMINRAERLSD